MSRHGSHEYLLHDIIARRLAFWSLSEVEETLYSIRVMVHVKRFFAFAQLESTAPRRPCAPSSPSSTQLNP
jgi:hypothetical protein